MYFVKRRGIQEGPYTSAQINAMLAEGRLNSDDPACPQNTEDWQPLGSLPDIQVTLPPQPEPVYAPGSNDFLQRPVPRGLESVSNTAIASLAMGVLSVVVSLTVIGGILLALVAIATGCCARHEIKGSRGRFTGAGIALAGIIAGCAGIAAAVCFAIAYKSFLH